MESLFKLFETISPSGYQYKDKKSYHPFWMQEGGSEVTSYNDLTDLPKIGGVEVKGNKSLATYNLYSKDEVDALIEAIPSGTGLVKTIKEIDATMFADATDNLPPQVLNEDVFVHSFTIGDKVYVAGSNLQVMANTSGDLAFTYYDYDNSKGCLVILSSTAIEGEIIAIHCDKYAGMSSHSGTSSGFTPISVTLDASKRFHKLTFILQAERLYPDGSTFVSPSASLEVLLIQGDVSYTAIPIQAPYNIKYDDIDYNFSTGYFTLRAVSMNNSYDVAQDSCLSFTGGTVSISEEW